MTSQETNGHAPMRIGIDVGGTNTDAALLAGTAVLATAKVPTSADVIGGIAAAVRGLGRTQDLTGVDRVIIGTTHFINAVVQARSLTPVAAVRLATQPLTLEPFTDWPQPLIEACGAGVYSCVGGHQFDGRLLNELDEAGVAEIADAIAATGATHVAVSSVFSPLAAEHEERAAAIFAERIPGVGVTQSHAIGRLGILERENAAILNESLRPLAEQVVSGLAETFAELTPSAQVYLSQNDGTVMSLERARRYPITTIASGPTNSMRGAAFLSGLQDAIVVDVGGTTTDVGLLRNGFPRESAIAKDLGGVRSNFRIPEVASLGIGGGSIVHPDGPVLVGPDSVGFRLTEQALVFGGDVTTLTDVAVAAGLVEIGDPSLVSHLDPELVRACLAEVNARVGNAVEEAKLSAAELPVVIVGGGAPLVEPAGQEHALVRPSGGQAANAVGAALGSVGGEVDRIYSIAERSRAQVLDEARADAIAQAISGGASPESVAVVDEEDIPLSHLPGGSALRVRIKAVGELAGTAGKVMA